MVQQITDPDAQRLLDDIRSMNITDVNRERVVNRYLQRLIDVVAETGGEPPASTQGGAKTVVQNKTTGKRE